MSATKKIEAIGLKAVHALVATEREGIALETVYRWRDAMRSGRGISDDNKRLLMAATAALSENAIVWADFDPNAPGHAVEAQP